MPLPRLYCASHRPVAYGQPATSIARFVGALAMLLLACNSVLAAEPARNKQTELFVEAFFTRPSASLAAQEWGPIFQKMNVFFRVRAAVGGQKPETREQSFGTFRRVTAVAALEPNGRLVFEDRAFRYDDVTELQEWLNELKAYGAQGAPDGKPLWGLDADQFNLVFKELQQKVDVELNGLKFAEAVQQLDKSQAMPVRLTPSTVELLKSTADSGPISQTLEGFSKGAALAIVLRNEGLGFRPLRTPAGGIELTVAPLTEISDPWPVGWKLKESRSQTAPKLFEIVPVELRDVPLDAVLDAVAMKSGVPVVVDSARLAEEGVDLSLLKVNVPRRKTSWSLLLRSATAPHRLTRDLKIDELGQPFIWVTIFEPVRLKD